ncbi:MAG: sensor histidine kinase [Clostridiales bacterium]|nr:sensor histidine kinase [Clostridiales bacterium]
MKYITKGLIASYIVFRFMIISKVSPIDLILIMSLIAVSLLIEDKNKKILPYILLIEGVIIFLIGIYTDYVFWAMLILLFDILYTELYLFGVIFLGEFIYFKLYENEIEIWIIIALVIIVAYMIRSNLRKKKSHHDILDNERRIKYELELTKASLIRSNKELQRLTQAKERNRIARDLHDNIGHKIAGILIKLQASRKVMEKDVKKGIVMLGECIIHLKDALETLRQTVHNMYRHDKSGIEYISKIVDEYKFCETTLDYNGNFANCPERYLEALSYVLKEALTNTAKHSKAQRIMIMFTCSDGLVTMEITDNGVGCTNIKESLGIRSMRDRIKSLDGSFKIESLEGMKIKCIIPIGREAKNENNNS